MSTTFYIEIETELTLAECSKILLKDSTHELIRESSQKLAFRTAFLNFAVELLDIEESFSTSLGIKPSIRIAIFNFGDNFPEVIEFFMQWVDASQDNAALLFDGLQVQILWKNQELIRNKEPDLWTEEAIAIIRKPYRDENFSWF
jgi:hypothetical protein